MQKIKEWWGEDQNLYGTKMYQFQQKLRHIKTSLKKWNKEVFGNIQEEKRNLEVEMERVQGKSARKVSHQNFNIWNRSLEGSWMKETNKRK
jgi:spore coat protein CotF